MFPRPLLTIHSRLRLLFELQRDVQCLPWLHGHLHAARGKLGPVNTGMTMQAPATTKHERASVWACNARNGGRITTCSPSHDTTSYKPPNMLSAFTAKPIVELKQRDKSKIESILAYGMELLVACGKDAETTTSR